MWLQKGCLCYPHVFGSRVIYRELCLWLLSQLLLWTLTKLLRLILSDVNYCFIKSLALWMVLLLYILCIKVHLAFFWSSKRKWWRVCEKSSVFVTVGSEVFVHSNMLITYKYTKLYFHIQVVVYMYIWDLVRWKNVKNCVLIKLVSLCFAWLVVRGDCP